MEIAKVGDDAPAAEVVIGDVRLLADGTTVLDFNMSYNPPCAFNLYTTCPIPLQENRPPVRILAGERAYAGRAPYGGG